MALKVGPGDEVIVPNRTWVATAHAAILLGAKVVLVDCLPDIPAMDIAELESKITPRTKAILPVHLNGRAVNMDELNRIARKHKLAVVEDACQALFSKNAAGYLGTQSDIGCFSLGVSKLISTGQGGIAVTRSREIYEQLKLVRNHGVVDNFTDTWNQLGCNFKFTDLLASFGIVQLSLASERIAHVKAVYGRYMAAVAKLNFMQMIPVKVDQGEVPLYVEVFCKERKSLMEFLKVRGIQLRPSLPSLHTSSYFGQGGAFPNSLKFAEQGMYLPCGPSQSLENVDRVIECLNEFKKS